MVSQGQNVYGLMAPARTLAFAEKWGTIAAL